MDSEASDERSGTLSSGSTLLSDASNLSLEDINTELLQTIQELSLAIDNYNAIEQNNSIVLDKYEDSKLIMSYKKSVVDGLTHELQSLKLTEKDLPHHYGQIVMDISTNLSTVLKDIMVSIEVNQAKLDALETEEACLNKNIETLRNISVKRNEEGEMREQKELERINAVLSTKFQMYKKWLHETIAEIFQDKEVLMQHFLADLCTAAMNNHTDGGYIDIEEEIEYKHIDLLLDADIIVRHPYEKEKVKLVSFV